MGPVHTFEAGASGAWKITQLRVIRGAALASAPCLDVQAGPAAPARVGTAWQLQGSVSHARYAVRDEVSALAAVQPGLGRAEATVARLIPIRKTPAWWALAQDERRALFEETSHHTRIGMDYLPAVARRLYHARDLGEPFDFLTWFEFAPEHGPAFEHLLARLRASAEWGYVEREIEVHLERA